MVIVELVKLQRTGTGSRGRPPFCLTGLSTLSPGFGASNLVPLQQRFLLRGPVMWRSAAFQSGSFSLSGITTTLCSGALGPNKNNDYTFHLIVILCQFFFHCWLMLCHFLNMTQQRPVSYGILLEYQNKCKWIHGEVYLETFSVFLRLLFPLLFPDAVPVSELCAFFFWPLPSSLSWRQKQVKYWCLFVNEKPLVL